MAELKQHQPLALLEHLGVSTAINAVAELKLSSPTPLTTSQIEVSTAINAVAELKLAVREGQPHGLVASPRLSTPWPN